MRLLDGSSLSQRLARGSKYATRVLKRHLVGEDMELLSRSSGQRTPTELRPFWAIAPVKLDWPKVEDHLIQLTSQHKSQKDIGCDTAIVTSGGNSVSPE